MRAPRPERMKPPESQKAMAISQLRGEGERGRGATFKAGVELPDDREKGGELP